MDAETELLVRSNEAGHRIDSLVCARQPELSRSLVQKLIAGKQVTINGHQVKASHRVSEGDRVLVNGVLPPSLKVEPESIPIRVIYQDEDLLVLDKTAGLVVHPAPGHPTGTLVNGLVAMFPTALGGDSARPGIVHRLDKDTSGLMVVALTPEAQGSLQRQIASREVVRRYLALAGGDIKPSEATIRAPIGRDTTDRKRMAVDGAAARDSETSYRVLERFPGFTLVEARLHTGRTHQIRVHFAALGHALAGDRTYGGPSVEGLERQFLHARYLQFRSPSSGKDLVFRAEPPDDLTGVLARLRMDA